MTPMDMLLTRASCDRLVEPAPEGLVLEQILAAAMRAPDHGKLRPWRFVLVRGENRPKLAERVVASMRRLHAEPDEKKIAKRLARFSTMPLTIALGMRLRPEDKIPLIEQKMAVAAAVMNVQNALHACGFGSMWVSGDITWDPVFAGELGFAEPDGLAGFLFVGTPEGEFPTPKRRDPADYTAEWSGKPAVFEADQG